MSWILGIMGLGAAGLLAPRPGEKRTARSARAARKQAHQLIVEAYTADLLAYAARTELKGPTAPMATDTVD